jgi:DNA-binding beta-propeller fold protein YncE
VAKVRGRVRAPELRGAGWVNSGELSLAALRGRFVLLDFWTSACANCLHVLDELRPIEERGDLVVLGVHSPKFPHEAELSAVRSAVERYGVRHPVLSDPDLHTWGQYAVSAWPTLVLVDPDGYVVARAAGEGHAAGLADLAATLAPDYVTVPGAPAPAGPPPAPETGLRYPGGIARTPAGTLLVADAGHHSVVETAVDGTVLRRIGTGERGRTDGGADVARFAEPQGVTVLPDGTAVVADTGNHLLRTVRLDTGEVGTLPIDVAGMATITGPVPPVLSPWDIAWWDGRLAVAAAGVHLLVSPSAILAGTTVEGLRDGPAGDAWLAQPSGLAADGPRLWFVDAETSSLRWLQDGVLGTAAGAGLFDFGLVDGPAEVARFQHPLGVTLLPDRTLAVLDTYNGAVRHYDPRTGTVATLRTGLAEPTGAVVVGGELVVVESAAHRLTRVPLPPTAIGRGEVAVRVHHRPRAGRKIDDRWGPATTLTVGGARTEGLATTVTGPADVTARAASCDDDACYLAVRSWRLEPADGGPDAVDLLLDDQPGA